MGQYYCVMNAGKRRYVKSLSQSIAKTAFALTPGTVCGYGKTKTLAQEDAMEKATAARLDRCRNPGTLQELAKRAA